MRVMALSRETPREESSTKLAISGEVKLPRWRGLPLFALTTLVV